MSGVIDEDNETMRRVCRKLMADLDLLCGRDEFPAVAETLLQNFDDAHPAERARPSARALNP